MFELIAVDGVPVGTMQKAEEDKQLIAAEKIGDQLGQVIATQRQIVSMLLAQQQEISRLSAALATVRISRTQELALKEAIAARAAQIARQEALPESCARKLTNAIRKTLRETTGARAIGDLQAAQFDRAMEMVGSWYMTGAIRKIRREAANGQGET